MSEETTTAGVTPAMTAQTPGERCRDCIRTVLREHGGTFHGNMATLAGVVQTYAGALQPPLELTREAIAETIGSLRDLDELIVEANGDRAGSTCIRFANGSGAATSVPATATPAATRAPVTPRPPFAKLRVNEEEAFDRGVVAFLEARGGTFDGTQHACTQALIAFHDGRPPFDISMHAITTRLRTLRTTGMLEVEEGRGVEGLPAITRVVLRNPEARRPPRPPPRHVPHASAAERKERRARVLSELERRGGIIAPLSPFAREVAAMIGSTWSAIHDDLRYWQHEGRLRIEPMDPATVLGGQRATLVRARTRAAPEPKPTPKHAAAPAALPPFQYAMLRALLALGGTARPINVARRAGWKRDKRSWGSAYHAYLELTARGLCTLRSIRHGRSELTITDAGRAAAAAGVSAPPPASATAAATGGVPDALRAIDADIAMAQAEVDACMREIKTLTERREYAAGRLPKLNDARRALAAAYDLPPKKKESH